MQTVEMEDTARNLVSSEAVAPASVEADANIFKEKQTDDDP